MRILLFGIIAMLLLFPLVEAPRIDNLNIIQDSAIITLDTSNPVINNITFTNFANNSFVSRNLINITYNVSDAYNSSILFYVNGVKNATFGYISNLSQIATLTMATDGNYTILFEANDSANNKLNSSFLYVIIDTNAPSIVSFNLTNNTFTKDRGYNITLNATDLYTDRVLLFVNDVRNATIPFRNGIATNITLNSSDGNYTLNLQFNDTAGNIINSSTRNIVIDTTSPIIISFNLSNNTFTQNSNYNITLNATDLYTERAVLFANSILNSTISYGSGISTNINFNASDGNYTLNLQFNDTAGNIINSSTRTLVIDTTAPTFIFTFNRTATDNSTSITTATNVNLSIFGLDDLYLNTLNISENCTLSTGAWQNHSITIIGNQTPYYQILDKTNFTEGQVCGWKFDAYDIAGNHLDPINTFMVGSPPSIITASGGGGGGGGGGNLNAKCIPYVVAYNDCFYLDEGLLQCFKGCRKGFYCQNLECYPNANTTLQTSSLSPIVNIGSWWDRIMAYVGGLFSTNADSSITAKLAVVTPLKEISNNLHEVAEPSLLNNSIAVIHQNPYIGIIALGIIALAVVLFYFGMIIFINPIFISIASFIVLIFFLLWYYKIF